MQKLSIKKKNLKKKKKKKKGNNKNKYIYILAIISINKMFCYQVFQIPKIKLFY